MVLSIKTIKGLVLKQYADVFNEKSYSRCYVLSNFHNMLLIENIFFQITL